MLAYADNALGNGPGSNANANRLSGFVGIKCWYQIRHALLKARVYYGFWPSSSSGARSQETGAIFCIGEGGGNVEISLLADILASASLGSCLSWIDQPHSI